MTYSATLKNDPAVVKAIADAVKLGDAVASDALTFAQSVIGHVSGATPGAIADVSAAALAAFYDAIPGGIRGTVQAIVGGIAAGSVTNLDNEATNDVLGALGLAVTRIEYWFSEYTPSNAQTEATGHTLAGDAEHA